MKREQDYFLTKVSTEEQDFELLKPFLKKDEKLMLWMVRNMKRLRKKASETEIRVGKFMYLERIIFIPQAPFLIHREECDKYYFADFYIPALKTIIEVDGEEHNLVVHRELDKERDADFSSIGIKTIRIPSKAVWNKEYKKYIPIPAEKYLRQIRVIKVSPDATIRKKEKLLREALHRQIRH